MSHPRLLLALGAAVATLALAASAARAAVPGQIDFQGLLLDSGGSPVNGANDLDFELFDAPSGGSSLWSESHVAVSVVDGVYDVTLGETTPITPALLSGGAVYLEITVAGETLSPRERLVAVPYALSAASAESAGNVGGFDQAYVTQMFEHFAFDGADPPNDDPSEGLADPDGDGLANFVDTDNDGDGFSDSQELAQGSDINLVTPRVTGFDPPTADGFETTTVEVQGQNFAPGLSVVFGSETPTPSNVTPTSFDVQVGPQAEGSAAVQVTHPNGEQSAVSTDFAFFLLVPQIDDITPGNGYSFQSRTVTVTGSNFAPGLSVSLGSESPTPANLTPTSFEVTVGPQPVGPVTVQVTHPNGKVSNVASFVFIDHARVFASSTTTRGNIGGIAGGDALCQARADAAGISGSFIAWLSDGSSSPATRLAHDPGLSYRLPDDTVVADDFADLTDGTIDAAIGLDELGNPLPSGAFVYTSTKTDGPYDGPQDCEGWTTSASGPVGRRGDPSLTDAGWTRSGISACVPQYHLYCFHE